jgi:ABC-type dipeptide/oligopeptide/nickel transport system permease subunit
MDVLNYIFNAPTYAAKDLREMGPALRTAGSELIKPIVSTADAIYRAPKDKKIEAVKKAFADTINNDRVKRMAQGAAIGAGVGTVFTPIGTLGGTIIGGLAGLVGPKNFAN